MTGQFSVAARISGAVEALCRLMDVPRPPADVAYDRAVATVREAMGDAAFNGAWSAGHTLTLDQIVAEALSELGDGPTGELG
jgi:hypothetical protein